MAHHEIYAVHGITDFVVCCGYRGHVIREYFANYRLSLSDVTFDLAANTTIVHQCAAEPWRVTLVETGDDTMTGGRLKRVRRYVGNETFCLTYGDGVSDVHIGDLVAFHKRQGTYVTLTAVQPTGRFGTFSLYAGESLVRGFKEKPKGDGAWVNGGFFVCEPAVFDYVESDATVWENEPLEPLSREGQLSAFRHQGFWQSMDTLRDHCCSKRCGTVRTRRGRCGERHRRQDPSVLVTSALSRLSSGVASRVCRSRVFADSQ